MHFDHEPFEGVERVEDGHRGVSEGGRIDNNAAGGLARFMDPVDNLIFTVRLVKGDLKTQLGPNTTAISFDIGQRFIAVDARLPLAEQVEVRSIEE
jgi:hypothetical protein